MKKIIRLTECDLQNIISDCVNNILSEVRYIDVDSRNKYDISQVDRQKPIMDNESIRVFHGCTIETAYNAITNGLSGMSPIGRTYSYENGMNPNGLFVTTDFNRAKNFGYSAEANCILEFTVKAYQLDIPVWNGQSTYFVQNSNPIPFSNREERLNQKNEYIKQAKVSGIDYISKSERPELADSIFRDTEHQALFIGNLDPNQIKRVWVKEAGDKGYISTEDSYKPFTRKQFLKYFNNKESNYFEKNKNLHFYRPNEDFNGVDDCVRRYMKVSGVQDSNFEEEKTNLLNLGFFDKNRVLDLLSPDVLAEYLWPKQIIQIYGKDFFDEYYNRLGVV